MFRGFLTLLLLLLAFWVATSAVVPPSGVAPDEEPAAIWRRTDQGWQRADGWLKPNDHLRQEPVPPLYPIALLPLIVAIGLLGLIFGQPEHTAPEAASVRQKPHFVKERRQQNRAWRE